MARPRKYRSFADARAWARSKKIRSSRQWGELCKQPGWLPDDIPANLRLVYGKEFTSSGDFLGTGIISNSKRQYRSFEDARAWARSQNIQSETQWRKLSKKSGWLPKNIPANLPQAYKSSWEGFGDFFGTGRVATQHRKYRSFADARIWARSKKIQSETEWNKLIKQPEWLPDNIPHDPRATYRSGGFTTFGDFLGTGNRATSDYKWRSFSSARTWAREQNLDDREAWKELAKTLKLEGRWPTDIPIIANFVYSKRSEWKGWEDFLGIQKMAKRSKMEERLKHELARFLPIDLSLRRVSVPNKPARLVDICSPSQRLVIEFDGAFWHKDRESYDLTKTELLKEAGWTVVRIREFPLGPITPFDVCVPAKQNTFKRALAVLKHLSTLGYVSLDAVLQYEAGGRTVNHQSASGAIREKFSSFVEARAWAQALGIQSESEWKKLAKREDWPSDIPRHPRDVYADEFTTWGEFIGTGRVASFNREYRSFEQARGWAQASSAKSQTQWGQLAKQEGWLPLDIPANPSGVYKGKGKWTTWGDFLGSGNQSPGKRKYRSFVEAREWARSQHLSSRQEWVELSKAKKIPADIPATPRNVFSSEWLSWGDFLGTGFVAFRKRDYLSYSEAQAWAQTQRIQSSTQWIKFSKEPGWLPPEIPKTPWCVYSKKWKSWDDFLGINAPHKFSGVIS